MKYQNTDLVMFTGVFLSCILKINNFEPTNLMTIWPKLGHANMDGSFNSPGRIGIVGCWFSLWPGPEILCNCFLENISGIWMLEHEICESILYECWLLWMGQPKTLDWRRGLDHPNKKVKVKMEENHQAMFLRKRTSWQVHEIYEIYKYLGLIFQ